MRSPKNLKAITSIERRDMTLLNLLNLSKNGILGGKVILESKDEITQSILEFELEDGKRLDLHITSTAQTKIALFIV